MYNKDMKKRSQEMKTWLDNLITYYRNNLDSLDDEVRGALLWGYTMLNQPTQIDLFWVVNPDFQLMVLSHSPTRPDKEVSVTGPLRGSELIEKVEEWVNRPEWDLPFEIVRYTKIYRRMGMKTIADIMRYYIANMANTAKEGVYVEKLESPRYSMWVHIEELYLGLFQGNLGNFEPEDYFNTIVEDTVKGIEAAKPKEDIKRPGSPNEPFVLGRYSTYFFPPLLIGGTLRATSFEDWLTKKYRPDQLSEKIISMTVKDSPLWITRDGEIEIETPDRAFATKVVSLIFGACALNGITTFALHENELSRSEKNLTENTGGSYPATAQTLRTHLHSARGYFGRDPLFIRRKAIKKETLENLIRRYILILDNEEEISNIELWLQANTHILNFEYAQSFILSWVIIEKTLWKKWIRYLNKFERGNKIIDKLSNSKSWQPDKVLSMLTLNGYITEEDYNSLFKLKEARNNFVHKGKEISKSVSEESLSYAKRSVEESLHELDPSF